MSSRSATTTTPSKRSSKPMRILVATYSIVLILSTWVVAFFAQCLFWLLSKPFLSSARQTYYLGLIFRLVSALVTALNPFWSFTRHGRLPEKLPKKLLVMCNHVSNLDPFVTCRALLPLEAKYVAKSSLFSVPFGGWCMWMGGDIPVYFTAEKGGWGTAKGSVGKMMETCKSLVESGTPILVYPEGVRSGCMEPREYKNGMFQFALDNDCAILPIALNNTHRAWSRKDVLDVADIHVKIGELITPQTKDVEELKNIVRTQILKLTSELPNTDYSDIPAPSTTPAPVTTIPTDAANKDGLKKEL